MLKLITKQIKGVGCFGELYYEGQRIAVSVERDWENNKKNVSCIPAGTYTMQWHESPKFGEVIALENPHLGVTLKGQSQRTYCYIHSANFPHQLNGCIALGTSYHHHQWGTSDSKTATAIVYSLFKANPNLTLEIIRL